MCFLDWLTNPAPQFVRKTGKQQRRKVEGAKQKVTGMHTFTIHKAYCCPAWPIVSQALQRYHIPITGYEESTVAISSDELFNIPAKEALYKEIPAAAQATFSVPKQQAAWAEYLLWSTGRLIVVAGNISKRNQVLGERRAGVMPLPWHADASAKQVVKIANRPSTGPWLESECKAGQLLWKEAKLAADKAKKGKRR